MSDDLHRNLVQLVKFGTALRKHSLSDLFARSDDEPFNHDFSTSFDELLAEHETIDPTHGKVPALLRRCADEPSAYRRFLEIQQVNSADVTTNESFQDLRLMGKSNYM